MMSYNAVIAYYILDYVRIMKTIKCTTSSVGNGEQGVYDWWGNQQELYDSTPKYALLSSILSIR
jgi:hypothetical protein